MRHAGCNFSETGVVVGFAGEYVEVKFACKISRHPHGDVEACVPAGSTSEVSQSQEVDISDPDISEEGRSGLVGSGTSPHSCFDGVWIGRGEIRGEMLKWFDGPTVHLTLTGPRTLDFPHDGKIHRGSLSPGGCLLWDDGDVWRRDVAGSGELSFQCLIAY